MLLCVCVCFFIVLETETELWVANNAISFEARNNPVLTIVGPTEGESKRLV
jgi:hypothetical protein